MFKVTIEKTSEGKVLDTSVYNIALQESHISKLAHHWFLGSLRRLYVENMTEFAPKVCGLHRVFIILDEHDNTLGKITVERVMFMCKAS
jgi:hypothetical protein